MVANIPITLNYNIDRHCKLILYSYVPLILTNCSDVTRFPLSTTAEIPQFIKPPKIIYYEIANIIKWGILGQAT